MKNPKLYNRYLLLLAFVGGMSIMALEMTATRLVAPYYGTSQIVWTNVIAIAMIGLSLGYFFGGKLADKSPKLKTLLIPIFTSGLIFMAIPWLIKPIDQLLRNFTDQIESGSLIIFIGSLLSSIMLFFLPIFLLAIISPFIIRIYKSDKAHLGTISGKIFACSTFGSIIGTFLPTLILTPIIGTRSTISLFASLLILISLFGLIRKKIFTIFFIPLLFIPTVILDAASIKESDNLIYETESAYQYIQVKKSPAEVTSLIFNEGSGIQSVYHPKATSYGLYYDFMIPLVGFYQEKDQVDIAIIGLAGGTLSSQFNQSFPEKVKIDGVEIDKKVIEIAKEYFEIENENLEIFNQDGRTFLQNTNKKYDIVIIDAYSNQLYIPWTMTTKEFWEIVKSRLNEDGIMTINVNSNSPNSELLVRLKNTISKVFDYNKITSISHGGGWNYQITSSNKNFDFNELNKINRPMFSPQIKTLIDESEEFFHDELIEIFTDDKAPIEQMTDKMIKESL